MKVRALALFDPGREDTPPAHQVDVCLGWVPTDRADLNGSLAPDEVATLESTVAGAGRDGAVARRIALRTVLARYLGCSPSAVPIVRSACALCGGPHGKPVLATPGLHFSCSGRGQTVAVAVAARPVGVDIERVPTLELVHDVTPSLHADDIAALLHDAEPRGRFAQIWSRKEAVLKASSIGLTGGTAAFSSAEDGPVLFAGHSWTVTEVPAPAGHRAAVALQQP